MLYEGGDHSAKQASVLHEDGKSTPLLRRSSPLDLWLLVPQSLGTQPSGTLAVTASINLSSALGRLQKKN